MDRRKLLLVLGAALLSTGALGQPAAKVWRIGVLEPAPKSVNGANMDGFRKGMAELGYREDRDFVLLYRSSEGDNRRFPELAGELVRAKVDLILARGTPATLAAKQATTAIPVVTTAVGEPLLVVTSLARPGGNVTGLTAINTVLQGKRAELMREFLPGVKLIGRIG